MDVERALDPELAAAFAGLPIFSFDWSSVTIPEIPAARSKLDAMRPASPAMQSEIEDLTVEGPEGAPDIGLRIYRPAGAAGDLPCLYWIHGGGYIAGSAYTPDARLDRWATTLGCVVVSVEYRLAPETPFPGPLEDVYAGLRWTANNPERLRIDPARIVIGGGSAGGGLCAGLALLLRDRGEIAVTYQLLIYPMIDDRQITASSNMETIGWTGAANRLGWSAYLGREPGSIGISPLAAPAREEDLAGLPDAFICVGTLDIFVDEDIEYARRLNDAGVATELHVYPGAPHAFEMLAPDSDIGSRCRRELDQALTRALARSTSNPR